MEVDSRVAYAYLLNSDEIVSDVWLYNVVDTPETVDWHDRSLLPFLNPLRYCDKEKQHKIRSSKDVVCNWVKNGVEIFINGEMLAILQAGKKPGWSRNAKKDGPLALVLDRV